jgi:polysaccharide export outer membrane protein
MDIIASAGGVRAPVHESYVRVTRGNGSASVPLSIILTRPQENIFVRPGDVVTVVRDPQSFTVIGAAGRNQTVQFDAQGISFAEALAKSGGVLDYRADPQGVFLLRFEPESIARKLLPPENPLLQQGGMIPIVYRFNMLEASQIFLAQRFPMRNRDILYVSNAPMAELQKMLQIVQSVTSPVVTGVGIAAATR